MTAKVPYPIFRVIIFGVVVPLLSLWYLVHAISMFFHNPTNASFNANVNLLVTMVKALFFLFVGLFSFVVPEMALNARKEKIKEAQAEEQDHIQESLRQQEYKAASEAEQRRLAQQESFVEARRHEAVSRADHIEQLREQLAELKGTTATSVGDDSDLEEL